MMNAEILKNDIITAILKVSKEISGIEVEDLPPISHKIWLTIADTIVRHIQQYAVVNVTVASVSGVTAGIGASGPGAGTGKIL
jgi:hypothetical protein